MTAWAEPEHYVPAFGKVPLAFGAAEACALPGPILIELVRVMDDASVAATKSLLHRMVAFGLLSVDRVGRVGVYRMIGEMLAGYEAIRDGSRLRSPEPWDGAFHTLIYDIPESQRALRDRVRSTAFRIGYRQLRPGVLISPTDESARFDPIVEPGVTLLSGSFAVELDTARRIAALAWDMDAHASLRREAIARLRAVAERPTLPRGAAALRLMHEVFQPVADIRFNDGDLPHELLPPDWPSEELEAILWQVTARLADPVDAFVASVVAASPHRALVEPDQPAARS